MEKINIFSEEEHPLGEVISHKDENNPDEDRPENMPEMPEEEPEMPEEEPQVEEIIPEPPKEEAPPPPPPDKGWLRKIWKRKNHGADKPN